MKTKLGVSVAALGAATYFMGLLSGYVALLIVVGYILLFESNEWLKRTAVKSVTVCLVFSVASALLGFIPEIIGCIDDFLNLFNGSFYIAFISKIVTVLGDILTLLEKALLLGLGIKALSQGTINIDFIDSFVDKHMKSE